MVVNYKNIIRLLMTISVLICAASSSYASSNPHNKQKCSECHKGDISFDEIGGNVELITDNHTSLCLDCHEDVIAVHHPQRVQVTGDVPDFLPLSEGRSITCITCHDIHSENTDTIHLLRSANIGDYTSRVDLCYACHIDNFKQISPHISEEMGLSCLVCHRETPTIKDTRETVTLVNKNIEKMCNFCHMIDDTNHPLNVDTTVKLSGRLPRSKDGKVVCTTCHDPHGTIETINYLRDQYVMDLEFGKYDNPHNVQEYFNCMKCHEDIPGVNDYINCKYKDDFILLCYTCHGADAEKCHPVNVKLQEGMTLPQNFSLDDDGLISCVTCHNPDCSENKRIKYIKYDSILKSSCKDCHDFSDLAGKYPHISKDDAGDGCYICHKKSLDITDFGMSQKFVCMKCHMYKIHPENGEFKLQQSSLLVDIDLDKAGRIKCSTCHDPHDPEIGNFKLKNVEEMTVCEACHQS
ncbi:cytochrome c3 family protein [Thermodesulfobacteriota bacterium]